MKSPALSLVIQFYNRWHPHFIQQGLVFREQHSHCFIWSLHLLLGLAILNASFPWDSTDVWHSAFDLETVYVDFLSSSDVVDKTITYDSPDPTTVQRDNFLIRIRGSWASLPKSSPVFACLLALLMLVLLSLDTLVLIKCLRGVGNGKKENPQCQLLFTVENSLFLWESSERDTKRQEPRVLFFVLWIRSLTVWSVLHSRTD